MAKWTEQQLAEAVALASTSSLREASRQTGIPLTTLRRAWRAMKPGAPPPERRATGSRNGAAALGEKLRDMADEVRQRAIAVATERVAERLTDRLERLADQLYALAFKAATKVDIAISDPDEAPEGKLPEPHTRDGAAWVRALVGVLAQAVDKAQLLAGKPTARPEMLERREYYITERIVSEHPELLDAIFDRRQAMRHVAEPGVEDAEVGVDSAAVD